MTDPAAATAPPAGTAPPQQPSPPPAPRQRCCFVQIDGDGYHVQSRFNHRGFRLTPVVISTWTSRIADAFKIDFHHIPALIGNGCRFVVYLVLAIIFPIGLTVGALNKKEDGSRDVFMVYRRAWKNLKFVMHNLDQIVSYSIRAIPLVGNLCVAYVKRTRSVSRQDEAGATGGGSGGVSGAATMLTLTDPSSGAVGGGMGADDLSAPHTPPAASSAAAAVAMVGASTLSGGSASTSASVQV